MEVVLAELYSQGLEIQGADQARKFMPPDKLVYQMKESDKQAISKAQLVARADWCVHSDLLSSPGL